MSGTAPSITESIRPGALHGASGRFFPTLLPALLLALPFLAACGPEEVAWQSPMAFDTARVEVQGRADTAALLVEVAQDDEQRAFGLMVRPELAEGSGMIFLYDSIQPPNAGYWMWRTRIPLDIAYLDRGGRIVALLRMPPCESPYAEGCPTYPPGEEYVAALETNQGWFASHGFAVGDRVVVDSVGPDTEVPFRDRAETSAPDPSGP